MISRVPRRFYMELAPYQTNSFNLNCGIIMKAVKVSWTIQAWLLELGDSSIPLNLWWIPDRIEIFSVGTMLLCPFLLRIHPFRVLGSPSLPYYFTRSRFDWNCSRSIIHFSFFTSDTHRICSFVLASHEIYVYSSACSPSGKLVQIEYALNAVSAGATSLGIKGENHTILQHVRHATYTCMFRMHVWNSHIRVWLNEGWQTVTVILCCNKNRVYTKEEKWSLLWFESYALLGAGFM